MRREQHTILPDPTFQPFESTKHFDTAAERAKERAGVTDREVVFTVEVRVKESDVDRISEAEDEEGSILNAIDNGALDGSWKIIDAKVDFGTGHVV